jgi:uncharacterized protein (DUF1501 family)
MVAAEGAWTLAFNRFGRANRQGVDALDPGGGGALAGGRVIADWPGVEVADLYDQRDVKATTDLRAALKGVLAKHLGLSADVLARRVPRHARRRADEGSDRGVTRSYLPCRTI